MPKEFAKLKQAIGNRQFNCENSTNLALTHSIVMELTEEYRQSTRQALSGGSRGFKDARDLAVGNTMTI